MRFAFISTMAGSPWGGSEELWSQAAVQLRRAGHEVQASVMYWPRLSDKITHLRRQGLPLATYPSYHAGPLRRFWDRLLLRYRRSYERLKRFNPDLVLISQGYFAAGFDWARICLEAGIPYAIIVQCNSECWWIEGDPSEAAASYRLARKVFCVSRHNLDLLRNQVGEPLPNAEVAYNPYNVSTERAPAWPAAEVWRLACVARLDLAAKGQDILLRTLAQSQWRGRPVDLNLFGDGPHQQSLRRLCELLHLNNIHFKGHIDNIRSTWEQNHLLVLPSRYEGLPMALVEAMWCGRPAVVTDVGGNAELCLDGETGFVAPAATETLFGQALERAWERRQEWPRLGQAARERAENLVPRDPVGLFCERLKALAYAKSGEGEDPSEAH
jgi:glycosyltransferase involved in cell wall biosynthesis